MPGFPVELVGVGEVHAAFLNESRTRGHIQCSVQEIRVAAIGLTEDWSMLFVVHMWREGDFIRIVSARLATAQERRSYEDNE
jgi:uncharacterized DUF497 family protein